MPMLLVPTTPPPPPPGSCSMQSPFLRSPATTRRLCARASNSTSAYCCVLGGGERVATAKFETLPLSSPARQYTHNVIAKGWELVNGFLVGFHQVETAGEPLKSIRPR